MYCIYFPKFTNRVQMKHFALVKTWKHKVVPIDASFSFLKYSYTLLKVMSCKIFSADEQP